MTIGATDQYATHDRQAMTLWWAAVRASARSTICTPKGTRIYVSEDLDYFRALPRDRALVQVHVVSVATGSMYEAGRFVNTPAVLRLYPLDQIAHVAPIVDADALI